MILALLDQLQQTHNAARNLLGALNEDDARRQYDDNLSPVGWHIGHMAVVETYWLREVTLGKQILPAWKKFYFPEFNPKGLRAEKLPPKEEMMTFACDLHQTNIDLLADLMQHRYRHDLLKQDYLPRFLIQHHSQHLETLQQIRQQRALTQDRPGHKVKNICPARAPTPPAITLDKQTIRLGHPGGPDAYDNELPRHAVDLAAFAIGALPVTNAEYLGFMEAQGYATGRYWSALGRRWLQAAQAEAPQHWRRDQAGHWHAVTADGLKDLTPDAPVYGVSYYEAEAFARYAGCRLPSEQEWEYAVTSGAIAREGAQKEENPVNETVWEWCANLFYPYPGFKSFPYSGYSTPWFGSHYVLRGGGRYTSACIKRPTFRNFYTADKRHIFAGLRLAKSP